MNIACRLFGLAMSCVVWSLGVAADAPPSPVVKTPPAVYSPLFDCFHINFAWGFSMSGKFIDSDGTIYAYRKTQPAWLPHEIIENGVRYLSDGDLREKFGETAQKVGNADAQVIQQHAGAIDEAAKGRVVHADGGARDAGSSSCHAYVRDRSKARYRDVDLGSDGGVSDMRVRNDAPQAQILLDWLKGLGVAK